MHFQEKAKICVRKDLIMSFEIIFCCPQPWRLTIKKSEYFSVMMENFHKNEITKNFFPLSCHFHQNYYFLFLLICSVMLENCFTLYNFYHSLFHSMDMKIVTIMKLTEQHSFMSKIVFLLLSSQTWWIEKNNQHQNLLLILWVFHFFFLISVVRMA